jgi:hypothetical protein
VCLLSSLRRSFFWSIGCLERLRRQFSRPGTTTPAARRPTLWPLRRRTDQWHKKRSKPKTDRAVGMALLYGNDHPSSIWALPSLPPDSLPMTASFLSQFEADIRGGWGGPILISGVSISSRTKPAIHRCPTRHTWSGSKNGTFAPQLVRADCVEIHGEHLAFPDLTVNYRPCSCSKP